MTTKKNRKEAQREQTYQALIEAAESLFAEHGVSAVSLRQIGECAGSFNTSVIGYYFGSKEALLEAIYRHRLPEFEAWRAAFLEDIDRRGLGMDIGELLKAAWMPWFEQRDKDGRHSYGRFLRSIDREGLGWTRAVLDEEFPASAEAHDRIRRYIDSHKLPNAEFRFSLQITTILNALYYIDHNSVSNKHAQALFAEVLEMAQASLMAGNRTPT